MKALQHNSPQWVYDHERNEDVLTWSGHMRVVRSRKRMRRLKRRGVPMVHTGRGDGTLGQQPTHPDGSRKAFGPWAWFESFATRDRRLLIRQERAYARFVKRHAALLTPL